jgi:hypothetical protein
MNWIIEREKNTYNKLNHESFPLFILYFLYIEHREKSIPEDLFSQLSEEVKKVAYNAKWLDEFFELYITEINDISVLENIEEKIKYLLRRYEHKAHWRIEAHWLKLLKMLDTYISDLVSEEHWKAIRLETVNQTEKIINWEEDSDKIDTDTKPTNQIYLKDNILSYDTWEKIYENIIWSLDKLLSNPEISKFKEIQKFRNSFSKESRGKIHIFIKVEDFLKHFKVIDFYEYIISIIEKNDDNTIKSELKKSLPVLQGNYKNNSHLNELQEKLQKML